MATYCVRRHLEVVRRTLCSNAPLDITKATKLEVKKESERKFIDWIRAHVKGGNGGDGGVSMLSLYKNEFAGPDGGNGGNGGHMIFRASRHMSNLNHLSSLMKAPNGISGGTCDMDGKNGEHRVIDVPIGTVFRNMDRKIVAELATEGSMFLAARGGAGGKGNAFFKTAERQKPMIAEKGGPGEHFTFDIELRVMAQAGLIGFPNAGKSTLLRSISRARPKVAAYPFTTLKPHIGLVPYQDGQIAVADIPGIIPDAHKNRGLGIAFLRHVERCLCLLYVIDMSVPSPEEQLECLRYELEQYSPGLSKRPNAIIGNKMDLVEAKNNVDRFKQWLSATERSHFIPVSAMCGQNIGQLLTSLHAITTEKNERKAKSNAQ